MDDKDLGLACGAKATTKFKEKQLDLVCKKRIGHQPTDCHADDGFIWWENVLPTTYRDAA